MDPQTLQAWIALFASAQAIGAAVVDGVHHLAGQHLTPEELQAVLAVWEDNAARSRANAGLPPE